MKSVKSLSLVVLLASVFLSCSNWKRGKFEITNNTPGIIDSVYIEPNKNSSKKYISIDPKETVSYITDMIDETNSGAYCLKFKTGAGQILRSFGYYSNGSSIEDLIKIQILPDTVLIKYIYNKK